MSEKKVTDEQLLEVIRCHDGQNLALRILANLVNLKSTQTIHRRIKELEKKGLITIKTGTFISVKDKQLPQYPGDNNAEQHIERLEHLLVKARRYVHHSGLPNAKRLSREIEQLVLEPSKGGE